MGWMIHMGNTNKTFLPDYVISPGEILNEELDVIGMTQTELSARLGLERKTVNEIINGKAPITAKTALLLCRIVGRSEKFWLNLESAYQAALARKAEKESLANDLKYLDEMPIKEMIRQGWIKKFTNKIDQLLEVLRFFSVKNVKSLEDVSKLNHITTSFRKNKDQNTKKYWSIVAWLRQGEILYKDLDVGEFNKTKFEEILSMSRKLTGDPLENIISNLKQECASAGVILLFVPELPGSGVCGATRWHNKTAVIQLSLRYKSNDQFWFTFFHEAGHILKHGRKNVFLEWCDNHNNNAEEDEADEFASNFLIDKKSLARFIEGKQLFSKEDIRKFAQQEGIAPGIVVGRLQNQKILPFSHCNDLKLKYDWGGIGNL